MSKSAVETAVADKLGVSKASASKMIDAVTSAINDVARGGSPVQLLGFGRFAMKHRAARAGRNPQTGEPITIAARSELAFKPAKG